jgi:hypothetical protein
VYASPLLYELLLDLFNIDIGDVNIGLYRNCSGHPGTLAIHCATHHISYSGM